MCIICSIKTPFNLKQSKGMHLIFILNGEHNRDIAKSLNRSEEEKTIIEMAIILRIRKSELI